MLKKRSFIVVHVDYRNTFNINAYKKRRDLGKGGFPPNAIDGFDARPKGRDSFKQQALKAFNYLRRKTKKYKDVLELYITLMETTRDSKRKIKCYRVTYEPYFRKQAAIFKTSDGRTREISFKHQARALAVKLT